MTDGFGPWQPATVQQIAELFAGAPFRWWLTGGVALELYARRSWRTHEDIDVGISRNDSSAVYGWLSDLVPYVAAGGRLRRWTGEPLSAERSENNVWVKRQPDDPWLFDIAFGDGDGSEWIYRRDPRICRSWSEVILRTDSLVPCLAPEIQLLFKSKGLREKDRRDAEAVIPLMEYERCVWLRDRLPADHPWQRLLRDEARHTESSPSPS